MIGSGFTARVRSDDTDSAFRVRVYSSLNYVLNACDKNNLVFKLGSIFHVTIVGKPKILLTVTPCPKARASRIYVPSANLYEVKYSMTVLKKP